MLLPSELEALILGNLPDEGLITPEKHREVENELLNYMRVVEGIVQGINISATPPVSLTYTTSVFDEVVLEKPSEEEGTTYLLVTLVTPMPNMNYKVRTYFESKGDLWKDLDAYSSVFKKINTSQFRIGLSKNSSETTNLDLHIEVKEYKLPA